jgi:hypothetical protein
VPAEQAGFAALSVELVVEPLEQERELGLVELVAELVVLVLVELAGPAVLAQELAQLAAQVVLVVESALAGLVGFLELLVAFAALAQELVPPAEEAAALAIALELQVWLELAHLIAQELALSELMHMAEQEQELPAPAPETLPFVLRVNLEQILSARMVVQHLAYRTHLLLHPLLRRRDK